MNSELSETISFDFLNRKNRPTPIYCPATPHRQLWNTPFENSDDGSEDSFLVLFLPSVPKPITVIDLTQDSSDDDLNLKDKAQMKRNTKWWIARKKILARGFSVNNASLSSRTKIICMSRELERLDCYSRDIGHFYKTRSMGENNPASVNKRPLALCEQDLLD